MTLSLEVAKSVCPMVMPLSAVSFSPILITLDPHMGLNVSTSSLYMTMKRSVSKTVEDAPLCAMKC